MLQASVYLPVIFGLCAADFVVELSFPDSVQQCFDNAKNEPVDLEYAKKACIQQYYNDFMQPRNLTDEDRAFFQTRVDQRFGLIPPKTGFRIRREIRTLSIIERKRFFRVLSIMYKKGIIQRFGRLHGQTKLKVHKGAAFLPWHRVFILDFEEEMRRIDKKVFLPYWDYTIDNNITKPSDSVVWSECFFGNGEGVIESGPFKNWYGGHSIQIRRDYALGGQCPPRLINKLDMKGILQHCYFENITTGREPFFENLNNLEMLHDGVHDWVGGDMDELPFSAFDPVFYMHHAFLDLIWEKFRQRQKNVCEVDPEQDWRPSDDLCQEGRENHNATDLLFGYPHLRNIDGCWNNFTEEFYRYEELPVCPYCGNSEFLYCDTSADPRYPKGLCLTKTTAACLPKNKPNTSMFTEGMLMESDVAIKRSELPWLGLVPGTVDRLKGIRGDGRSRDMSLMECKSILQAQIARGLPRNNTHTTVDHGISPTDTLLFHPLDVSRQIPKSYFSDDMSKRSREVPVILRVCENGCVGLIVAAVVIVALLICACIVLCVIQRKPARVLLYN